MKTILITNDDGYMSEGIILLTEQLRKKYNVFVVAPDRERSAISMGLTLNTPLRITQVGKQNFITTGTPIDCINLGLKIALPVKPDLIVSGINHGENVSEDIFYSGTVAGAFAGHLHEINSIAISFAIGKKIKTVSTEQLKESAVISIKVIDKIIETSFNNRVYNLNIPVPNNGTVLTTYPEKKKYVPDLIEKTDPRGRKYYWLGTGNPLYSENFGSDSHAIKNGYISLSTLKYDLSCKDTEYGKVFEQISQITE